MMQSRPFNLSSSRRMLHGRLVQEFDFSPHADRQPFNRLGAAATMLPKAIDEAVAKAAEIKGSGDLTATGRTKALREVATDKPVALIKGALEAMRAGDEAIRTIRNGMTAPMFDKTDVVAALNRQEIRQWLRTLKDSERSALFIIPEQVDPQFAAAVLEQPAELSGVTEQQRARVEDRALAARFPKESEEIALIGDAIDAVADHVEMATNVLRSQLGVGDIDELAGIRTPLQERLAEITADLPAA